MTERERVFHRRVLELAAAEYPGVAVIIVSEDVSPVTADPHVWIFCKHQAGQQAIEHMGRLQARSPHLTPAQARRVAKALLRFANRHTKKRKKARTR